MRFECPGCGESTPEVVAEGGKPVYCTQCGRGYRFIYGFYHRYLYFVFNHPFLTYSLLLIVALVMATSFRGPLKLLYLAFFTVFYWAALRWVQRSYRYLEQLPTGPAVAHAPAAVPPGRPAGRPGPLREQVSAPPLAPVRDPGPRLSLFAVFVFVLNLCVFPVALFAGFASLTVVSDLLLDLIHGTGGGGDLVHVLASTDLTRLRAGVAVYFAVVILVTLFLLALNILAFSVVRAKRNRGKELVIWALVFWLVSTALLGSQLVSGIHLITGWQAQGKMVREDQAEAYNLDREPLPQWTLLHAWRGNAEPFMSLLVYTKVLDRTGVTYDRRHEWITRGLAIELGADVIRSQAAAWSESDAQRRKKFLECADEFCLRIIDVLKADPDPMLRETAERALRRLRTLPFELPRSEKRLVHDHLFPAGRTVSGGVPSFLEFGRGDLAAARCLREVVDRDSTLDAETAGAWLHGFGERTDLAERLIVLYRQSTEPAVQHRILTAASFIASEESVPLIRDCLVLDGRTRYRSLQALYRIYRETRLPIELSRVKRYYRAYAGSRYADDPRYEKTHRLTARAWERFLACRPEAAWATSGATR
jgi:hypothetical protein